jgi:hypothetical protein
MSNSLMPRPNVPVEIITEALRALAEGNRELAHRLLSGASVWEEVDLVEREEQEARTRLNEAVQARTDAITRLEGRMGVGPYRRGDELVSVVHRGSAKFLRRYPIATSKP